MTIDSYMHKTAAGKSGGPLLFVFHGTGGDENQFLGLGRDLMPEATIVAPRGDVSEHGAARYFRRASEGVYDMDDLARGTAKMAGFISAHVSDKSPSSVIGLGYSNGANILASVLFAEPDLFDAAVLMHPLIPFEPRVDGHLRDTKVLVTAGRRDPICPQPQTLALEQQLRKLGATVETFWHDGGHEIRQGEIVATEAFLSAWRD